jgi:hypothetical protein
MRKLLLIVFLMYSAGPASAQQPFLTFKKKNKTLRTFSTGSYIAFQDQSREWRTGYITKIKNDSFAIRPMFVTYALFYTDTTYLNVQHFSLANIYAMPKKGLQVDYKNGRFKIRTNAGHVHWYWIKSGWVFRTGAAAYAGLNITNGLIQNDFSFQNNKKTLSIAAGVFLFGQVLHWMYKPTLRIGKKYRVQVFKFSS